MYPIVPPFLQPGDIIGITAPAGYVSHERTEYAIEVLRRWGFGVIVGNTIGTGKYYFAGTDKERLTDLQEMLDSPKIKAILMGRGGYGMSRIIDDLDFTAFRKSPKWICGFSDITVLHSHIHQLYSIASIHGPMCGAFTPASEETYYIQSLRKALTGQSLTYDFPHNPFNRTGRAEAPVVGGNLAMLAHMSGTISQLDTAGKILFIEDIGEHFYHVDRLLINLKRSGQLARLKGLIVGSFTEMEDTERPFGQTLEEIVTDKVAEYDFPVAFNFPCGHATENVTLVLGTPQTLTVSNSLSTLTNNISELA